MWLVWTLTGAVVVAVLLGHLAYLREHRVDTHENMRQALLWYADASHWRREHYLGRHWYPSPASQDRGARARKALERRGS